jgi:hypothetical protein
METRARLRERFDEEVTHLDDLLRTRGIRLSRPFAPGEPAPTHWLRRIPRGYGCPEADHQG